MTSFGLWKSAFSRRLFSATALGALAVTPALAHAQPTADGPQATDGISDIIVTAQKRSENVQDIPIAITAIGGDDLRNRQVTDVRSLTSLAPNVEFGEGHGIARIAIRGIGFNETNPGGEGRVAYHVDGVYISRPEGVLATFFDVDRVEVLRGPQGTLYGRNAVAGNINVITRDPGDTLEGYAQATIGNYQTVQFEGGLSVPLGDGIAFRIAGATSDRDGYGKNLFNGRDIDDLKTRSIRGKLKLTPTDNFSAVLTADYFRQKDSSGHLRWIRPSASPDPAAGLGFLGSFASDPADTNSDIQPLTSREIWGLSGTLEWKLSDALTLTSVTAYRDTRYHHAWDNDQTEKLINISYQQIASDQFSQELRASASLGSAKLVLGGFYFTEKTSADVSVPLNRVIVGLSPLFTQGYFIGGRLKTDAVAAFGQLTYDVSDQLSIDIGARYSHETKKKFDEVFQFDVERPYDPANPLILVGSIPFDKTTAKVFTPKFTVNFKPNDDVLLYATFSKGFKSGGFNLGGLQPAFEPEKITNYEAGLKLDLFDRRLRANVATFFYDYKNLQVSQTKINHTEVINAASAELYGMEAEITAIPVSRLQLNMNLGLLRSKFKEFETEDVIRPGLGLLDLAGNRLPQAPRYTISLGAQYSWDLPGAEMTLRGEGRRVGSVFFTPFNTAEFSEQAYNVFDAFLNFQSESKTWNAGLYVRNISNNRYISATSEGSTLQGAPVFGTITAPRTYGIRVGYDF